VTCKIGLSGAGSVGLYVATGELDGSVDGSDEGLEEGALLTLGLLEGDEEDCAERLGGADGEL
jgi:hypothetical protein